MNDLTNYELRALLWAVKYVRARTNNMGDVMRSLLTKLPSIIENNSCTHQPQNTTDSCRVKMCAKCLQEYVE